MDIVKATWAAYSSVLSLNLQNADNRMENSSFAKCQKIGGVNLLVKNRVSETFSESLHHVGASPSPNLSADAELVHKHTDSVQHDAKTFFLSKAYC